MSNLADELSQQATEFARRAMEIQAGHLADIRRKTSIWTVLSQPQFDGLPEITEPELEPVGEEPRKEKKKKKAKKKKSKKAKKKDKR